MCTYLKRITKVVRFLRGKIGIAEMLCVGDRLRWSGGMELCNKFDAVFIKNGVFEDIFINENLFNKKYIIIRRNSNEIE